MRIAMGRFTLGGGVVPLLALAITACSNGEGTSSSSEKSNSQATPSVTSRGAPLAGKAAVAPRSLRSPDGPRVQSAHDGRPAPHSRARFALHGAGAPSTGTSEAAATIYNGGLVLAAPKVVPVIFPGNPFDAQVRDFFAKLPGSSYWQASTAEYGVGPITLLPVYVPTGPVPTADTVDQWIADLAGSGAPGLPLPDDSTIYAIVLPEGWGADVGACVSFGGYHYANYTASGQVVIHTVNPTCGVPYIGLSGIDFVTFGLSHEIEESATDPVAGSGWAAQNWAASGWGAAGEGSAGAETADLCEFQPGVGYRDPQIGYLVQRIWSNQAEAAGHDPCRPALASDPVYFTAEPVLRQGTQVSPGTYARGISIAPGSEVTIPVVLRADGPIGEWTLSAYEKPNPHLSPDVYNELSFSWDRASGRAGDTRYLTIRRSPPPDGGSPVFLRVAIDSTLGSIVHTQWLVVGTE